MSGGVVLVLLETSGRLFVLDSMSNNIEAFAQLLTLIFIIAIIIIPIFIIGVLIRKLCKYLDAKTNYYKNKDVDLQDRQD